MHSTALLPRDISGGQSSNYFSIRSNAQRLGGGFATAGSGTRRSSQRNSMFNFKGGNTQSNEAFKTQTQLVESSPTLDKVSPFRKGPNYSLSVKQIVESSLKVSPFGIENYEVPKVERFYLLKPYFGKSDKIKKKNFTDIEAGLHSFVPGPMYNTTTDWTKTIPLYNGKFLKCDRQTPETTLKRREKVSP